MLARDCRALFLCSVHLFGISPSGAKEGEGYGYYWCLLYTIPHYLKIVFYCSLQMLPGSKCIGHRGVVFLVV